MLSALTLLLLNGLFFSLRVTGNTGSFPKPLTPEQEADCLARMAQGDESARNTLIEHNLRLVAHIAKKYFVQTDDQDDLVSIGTIGLIKAVNTFQPDRGIKLATYASRCIENEILMYLRRIRHRMNELSLSETLDTDSDGSSLSLMDVLYTDEDLNEALSTQEDCAKLRACLSRVLTEREYRVISLRYGFAGGEPQTQREVAAQCGISRSYVSRIEKKALKKLEDYIENH
ncbi:MAG: RNA polymerase sporulation sigma factor SigK [Oscillospiraceae bacterium]|nr:RNA polymerase sporulation sigma factor SigK [Oscillospiraceae bacterium]